MTDEQLQKLQDLRETATQGDVHLEGCFPGAYCEICLDGFERTPLIARVMCLDTGQANADYAAAAWNAVPGLVAEVRRCHEENAALRAKLERVKREPCAMGCASYGGWRVVGPCDCWKAGL